MDRSPILLAALAAAGCTTRPVEHQDVPIKETVTATGETLWKVVVASSKFHELRGRWPGSLEEIEEAAATGPAEARGAPGVDRSAFRSIRFETLADGSLRVSFSLSLSSATTSGTMTLSEPVSLGKHPKIEVRFKAPEETRDG